MDTNLQAASTIQLNLRQRFLGVTNKHNTQPPRLCVIFLAETIGDNVFVQHRDAAVGIEQLKPDSVFHRIRAAHPRTILSMAGNHHTLNHHHIPKRSNLLRVMDDHLLQILLRDDAR